jgi:hypothetical protein
MRGMHAVLGGGAVALLLLASACGGSGSVTRSGWITRASAICARGVEEDGPVEDALDKADSIEELAAIMTPMLYVLEGVAVELSELPVPEGDAHQVHRLISREWRAVSELRKAQIKLEATPEEQLYDEVSWFGGFLKRVKREEAAFERAADEFGLDGC